MAEESRVSEFYQILAKASRFLTRVWTSTRVLFLLLFVITGTEGGLNHEETQAILYARFQRVGWFQDLACRNVNVTRIGPKQSYPCLVFERMVALIVLDNSYCSHKSSR